MTSTTTPKIYYSSFGIDVEIRVPSNLPAGKAFTAAIERALLKMGAAGRAAIVHKDGRPFAVARANERGYLELGYERTLVEDSWEFEPINPGEILEGNERRANAEPVPPPHVHLDAIDALLAPVEAISTAILAGIGQRAKAEETRRRLEAAKRETREIPLASTERQPWDVIRALPEVAPLIAEGFKLISVERGATAGRVAVLERMKTVVTP